jgi:hypothetical protein
VNNNWGTQMRWRLATVEWPCIDSAYGLTGEIDGQARQVRIDELGRALDPGPAIEP